MAALHGWREDAVGLKGFAAVRKYFSFSYQTDKSAEMSISEQHCYILLIKKQYFWKVI